MPQHVLTYKCMIISPGDVAEARAAIDAAIAAWNAQVGPALKARVEAVRWERHSRPDLGGGGPQAVINDQLTDTCDFGVAIFWSRVGTPTADHESGSIEEIERLIARGAKVMMYFSDAPIPQDALRDDQFARLQEVKQKYLQAGLVGTFSTADQLREAFLGHLTSLVNELLLKTAGQPVPTAPVATAPLPDIRIDVQPFTVFGAGERTSYLSVTVQNHSPNDFFLHSINFKIPNNNLYVPKDALSGQPNTARIIRPGDSHMLVVRHQDLLKKVRLEDLLSAFATDKINRKFFSPAGKLTEALKQLLQAEDS